MSFPFRGFAEHRPYPATGLSTTRWPLESYVEVVSIGELWLTQRQLSIPPLFGVLDRVSDVMPHVVAHGGGLYLEDGHHRVVRQVLATGCSRLRARVYRGRAA